MFPEFKPSFLGLSLQSVIHIKIDSNTSISKRPNTHVNKRIISINAFHLKKSCLAFLSVSHTPPAPKPHLIPSISLGHWFSSITETVLLHGATGRFATVLLYTFEKQRPPVAHDPRLPVPNGRGVFKT